MVAARMTGLFSGLVLGWWLYDLQLQWRELQEYNFGWVVPALAGYIVLVRWGGRPTQDHPAPFWISMCLAGGGIPFVVVAEIYKRAITHTPASSFCLSIGCFLFVLALILRGWGHRTLFHFLFPLCFLFLAVPLPGIIWNPIVMLLRDLITRLDVECLNLIGIPAFQQVNVIQLPGSQVGVNDACSGIRSLQSSVMVSLFVGYLSFSKTRFRALFLAIGISLALFGNFTRSLVLSIAVHRHGLSVLDRFHDAAGWAILVFTLIGLMVSVSLVKRYEGAECRISGQRTLKG